MRRRKKRQGYVYILKCEDDTYYVGFSRWLHHRLTSHFSGNGAQWTKDHRPQTLLAYAPAKNERDEFQVWCDLVRKKGLKRVGGWSPWLCKQHKFQWPFALDISGLGL